MSWNAPRNWTEVLRSIEMGWQFHSTPLRVTGSRLFVLSDARHELTGHLDDFARLIIDGADARRDRYLSPGETRESSARLEDPIYFVARDGNAIAFVQRDGTIRINDRSRIGARRYREAVARIEPALRGLVAQLHKYDSDPGTW
ncbi:hypothetical protein SEA_MACGULLY_94 [Rhodococcus phage MacGully]|nr:hypothetical protein SEA_MACGULLY_94 [Rhodococcus phage MacGully]